MEEESPVGVSHSGDEDKESDTEEETSTSRPRHISSLRHFLRGLPFGFVIMLLLAWVSPFLFTDVLLPALTWLEDEFTRVQIGIAVIILTGLTPIVFLPVTNTTIWLAAICLGWVWGFLTVTLGTAIGMTFPFLLGRSCTCLQSNVDKLVDRSTRAASVVATVDKVGGLTAVFVFRLGPVPYLITNYILGIKVLKLNYFRHYIPGSVVGYIPNTLNELQRGMFIKTIADYLDGDDNLTPFKIFSTTLTLLATSIIVGGGYHYSTRIYQELEEERWVARVRHRKRTKFENLIKAHLLSEGIELPVQSPKKNGVHKPLIDRVGGEVEMAVLDSSECELSFVDSDRDEGEEGGDLEQGQNGTTGDSRGQREKKRKKDKKSKSEKQKKKDKISSSKHKTPNNKSIGSEELEEGDDEIDGDEAQ